MGGLGKQAGRKGRDRSIDMSGDGDVYESAPAWCPPPEECEDSPPYTFAPDGADPVHHRIKVRMVSHIDTDRLVEFATIQQTYWRGEWRNVASIDSCHNDEVHMHYYGKSADGRVGEPEHLMAVKGVSDIEDGYELAYVRLAEHWQENVQRWQHA